MRVLITGGSSGIGLASAEALAREGARVALLARGEEGLAAAALRLRDQGFEVETVAADVTDREELTAAVDLASERLGGLDLLVTSAAALSFGTFVETDPDDFDATIATVLGGTVDTIRAALPHLERSGGGLIATGSTAARMPLPTLPAYTAAKHALAGFLECLRVELAEAGSPVSVSLVNPGAVDTPLWDNLESETGLLPPAPPDLYAAGAVAEVVLAVARRPRRETFVGREAALQVALYSLLRGPAERALRGLTRLALSGGNRPANRGGPLRTGRQRRGQRRLPWPSQRRGDGGRGHRPRPTAAASEMNADAVVIGAGPNGLIAANMLADRGWDVVVCEEQPTAGGAVRSGEVTAPGFVHDLYSAFYPLTPALRYIAPLELESYGLNWLTARDVVAHPHPDGRCAVLSLDLERTCASLESFARGDGEAWRSLFELWRRAGPSLIGALLTPLPPLHPAAGLLRALGPRGLLDFARFALLPARRMSEERFRGEGGGWLIAANALHADLTPDSAGGGLFGWLLCGLGQQHGYPVAAGGAGSITAALVRRLRERGGEVLCETPIERIEVNAGRASAAIAADGRRFGARRAILADCGAPALYLKMLPEGVVPERAREELRSFQYDNSTFKLNWALRGPIPWSAEDARGASTIHVAEGMGGLARATGQLADHGIPDRPFLVLGQYSMVDPSRAPHGGEAAWAYTHVPQRPLWDAAGELKGDWAGEEAARFADRMEAEVERLAPGFRKLIIERDLQTPLDLEANNRNLVGGALNGGTAQLYQQAIFRPLPGLGRPTTPVRNLYLASSSAHPGGGLHGGPGGNAATTVLRRARFGL